MTRWVNQLFGNFNSQFVTRASHSLNPEPERSRLSNELLATRKVREQRSSPNRVERVSSHIDFIVAPDVS